MLHPGCGEGISRRPALPITHHTRLDPGPRVSVPELWSGGAPASRCIRPEPASVRRREPGVAPSVPLQVRGCGCDSHASNRCATPGVAQPENVQARFTSKLPGSGAAAYRQRRGAPQGNRERCSVPNRSCRKTRQQRASQPFGTEPIQPKALLPATSGAQRLQSGWREAVHHDPESRTAPGAA